MSEMKALIAGGTGAIGGPLAAYLAALPEWQVLCLCRTPPSKPPAGVDYVHADMTDEAACGATLAAHPDITHLFYAGRAAHDDHERESASANLDLLRHVLNAASSAAEHLRHVHLVQGGKYYGVHLGPFPTPAKEDDPRTVVSNFYYDQEDLLRERSVGSGWSWTTSRPNSLLHFSPGNPRNLVSTLGAYAAICRELGSTLDFPGPEGAFTSLTQLTSTGLLSEAIAWMASDDKAANQAFNVANGDLIRWSSFWPKLAASFGIPSGSIRPLRLADVMADKAPVWARIVDRFDLQPRSLAEIANWPYADSTLERSWDELMCTNKARKFGFLSWVDSEHQFFAILESYRQARILP